MGNMIISGQMILKEGDIVKVFGPRYPGSKWNKHLILWKDPALRPYLPETFPLNESNFLVLLRKYPAVFVKPTFGTGGKGIIKATRLGSKCMVQIAAQKTELPLNRVYRFIKKRTFGARCIVQQSIDLACIDGKPIDFRILLLKPESQWQVMGIMGKVAVKNQIVTNHCRGGSSILFKEAMIRSLSLEEQACEDLAKDMENLGIHIASALQMKYKRINQLGLDIAVDKQQKLWFIEANTRPQYQLFREHENPDLFRSIDRTIRNLRAKTSRLT